MSFGRRMRQEWALDPTVTYLNHGTVGAPPRRVLAAQQALRDEIERQPSRFLLRELTDLKMGAFGAARPRLREAAAEVAAFLGTRPSDLVFVPNATAGANAVLRSFPLQTGDEILLTDHAYGGFANAAAFVARERGAAVRRAELPYPPSDPELVVDAVDRAIGPRTRLAVIDHVTSESALVLPLRAIAARCRAHGVPVLADGAHAPGMIPVDIPALGVDWYAGNLHKWAWAPRSCGILWAPPERQDGLYPAVISWGLDSGFTERFDWTGTPDPTPFLAAPAGIAFMRELGLDAVRGYNHTLALDAARRLAERWGTTFEPPEAAVGAMVTVPLPAQAGDSAEDARRLRNALLFEDRIEVQLHAWKGRLWARASLQIYNDGEDVERLADAVVARVAVRASA